MKATALRIGNWIELPAFGDEKLASENIGGGLGYYQFQVNAALIRDADYYREDWAGRPIPLTEEWLVKFGFFEDGKGETDQHGKYFSVSIDDYCYSVCYADFRKDYGFYIEYTDSPFPEHTGQKFFISCGIKYVHQLQNLYHALTGEELTTKAEGKRIQVVISGNPVTIDGITVPPGFVYERSHEGVVTLTPVAGHINGYTDNTQPKREDLSDSKKEESITPEEHETLLNNAQDCLTAASPFWQTQKPLPSLRWVERCIPIDKHREKAAHYKVLQQLHQIEGNDRNGVYCGTEWIDVPVEKEEK